MNNNINFSIIIPVKEINSYLEEAIPKILDMDYKNYEILILPNEKPKSIKKYLKNSKIKIIPSGKVSPAVKRDLGAKKSKGKYLAFIDDDAYPQKNWLSVADELFKKEKIDAIGGPAITPKNDSLIQKASGLFFETVFGGGGMSYRYKPAKNNFYVDDFPSVNFIVSKKAFESVNGFNNDFWPGEDTKFCSDLIKKGYKILYSKDLVVYHHRRKSIFAHLKQVGNYGKHRGYFAKTFPETSLKPVYFAPSLFLLGNVILLICSIFNLGVFYLWMSLLAIYFVLVGFDVALRASRIFEAILTVILVFLSHITYGFRFLVGLFSRRFKSQLR